MNGAGEVCFGDVEVWFDTGEVWLGAGDVCLGAGEGLAWFWSTAVVDIVNIEERRKLTPSNSKKTFVLLLGKLMPYVDYFWKLIYM